MLLIQKVRHFLANNKALTKILGDSSWLLTANLVSILAGIIQISLISRLIGPEGIGIIGLFMAGAAIFQGLFTIKSAETILTFATKYSVAGNTIKSKEIIIYSFFIDITTAIICYIVLLSFASLYLKLFNIESIYRTSFIQYSLVVILSAPVVCGNALLRIRNLYKRNLAVTIAASLARLILTTVLFLTNATIKEVIWLYVLSATIEGIAIFYFSLNGYGILTGTKIITSIKNTLGDKEILQFQLQGYGREFIKSLSRYLDTLIVGLLSGSLIQVGYYRIAKQVSSYIQFPINSISAAIYPEFSRLWYAKKNKELRGSIKKLTAIFFTFSVIFFIAFVLFGNRIILLLFGNEFIEAQLVLIVILISAVINITMTPVFSLPVIVGNAKPALYSTTLALAFQIILMYILVPKYQAIGAAWSNVTFMIVWAIVLLPSIIKIYKKMKPNV